MEIVTHDHSGRVQATYRANGTPRICEALAAFLTAARAAMPGALQDRVAAVLAARAGSLVAIVDLSTTRRMSRSYLPVTRTRCCWRPSPRRRPAIDAATRPAGACPRRILVGARRTASPWRNCARSGRSRRRRAQPSRTPCASRCSISRTRKARRHRWLSPIAVARILAGRNSQPGARST